MCYYCGKIFKACEVLFFQVYYIYKKFLHVYVKAERKRENAINRALATVNFCFLKKTKKNRKKKERKKNPTGKSFVLIGITKYTGTAWICLWEDDLWKDSTAIGSPPECRYIRINIWIAAFFKIKNNINFVCEFWDHCIYESPHTSSMAAWRWFNMARRGTQHWSLPTVWGKVSSRLALYAGRCCCCSFYCCALWKILRVFQTSKSTISPIN